MRPLLLAAYIGNRHIVQLLLQYKADIYERDEVSRYILVVISDKEEAEIGSKCIVFTTEWCCCL